MNNIILQSDSYKVSHWKQYPHGTQLVHSYFESRGGDFDDLVFFGLQYILKKYMVGQVFDYVTIMRAEEYLNKHLGEGIFNKEGWVRLLQKRGGRLPLSIHALPEGSHASVREPLITVENTDPEFYWLTNFMETLLVQAWYPITVASLSRTIRKVILGYLEETGDPSLIDFKLHDFGFRGVSSTESAGIGGAAHLVNFKGTDTMEALIVANEFYGETCAGFSIPAAEHSTITSWGKEHEVDAYRNMLTKYPKGLVAVVSDSYDIYSACEKLWGEELKEQVLSRDGTLVIRPDSGNPPEVVVRVLGILAKQFGGAKNDKGYFVLNPKVRIIQGDGVDLEAIETILEAMKVSGFSADNIAFGMGGALLQKLHRDTCKFAFKCSAVVVDGVERDVFKSPVTDPGKDSKRGRIKSDRLVEVFRDGELLQDWKFEDIRNRANQ